MDSSENLNGVSVHTGFPNPATDASLQSLNLHKLLVPHGASTYLMRIEGDLWQASGIFAGDIIIIDRSLTPQNTDHCIWWLEDTFVISHRTKIPPEVAIWGVISATIHQFRKRELKP